MTNRSISASKLSFFDSPDCVRLRANFKLSPVVSGEILGNIMCKCKFRPNWCCQFRIFFPPQPYQNVQISTSELRQADAPSLLHFAAQYGFKSVSSLLLQCPGAERALRTANRHGQTPIEIAKSQGHMELYVLLKETLVTTSIFTTLK